MAITTLPAFTVDAATGASFGSSPSAIALPGTALSTDSVVLITNLGPCHLSVRLATTSTLASTGLTPSNGVIVLAGQQMAVALLTGQAFIGAVSCGGTSTSTIANIATGN
jgi:hypothetical protein